MRSGAFTRSTSLRIAARMILAGFLAFAAGAKLHAVLRGVLPLASASSGPYLVVMVAEAALALLLVRRDAAEFALPLTLGAFVASGLIVGHRVLIGAASAPCRCLGSIQASTASSLMIHGAILMLGAAVMASTPSRSVGA